MTSISFIIPTLNAGQCLGQLLGSLKSQSLKINQVIVVDSSSDDNTASLARYFGATVLVVERHAFDHGATRTLAGKMATGDILIYVTQDIVFVDDYSLENLIKPFNTDESIGACCGRQLPNPNASPSAAHLRFFNYPSASYTRGYEDRKQYGIKTAFLSNSFTAYRGKALERIGWFKENVIFGEDALAGAKLLLSDYKLAYVAEAMVYHSHNYKLAQDFKRYFDIGVLHARENWLLREFGKATGEGARYIKSELAYLMSHRHYCLVPQSFVRNALKFIGYQLGRNYDKIPRAVVKKISMHDSWWNGQSR
jgi:rhamnosyltransferase